MWADECAPSNKEQNGRAKKKTKLIFVPRFISNIWTRRKTRSMKRAER